VIGVLPGRDPVLAAELVVIGAHHDHLGRGEFGSLGGQAAIGEVHPGADDNASGVAALLAIAAQLAPSRGTSRTLVFVAFGAGEYGMQGSRTFLESGLAPKDKIAVMINLDMVGRVGQKGLKIESVGSGLGLADSLGRAARRAGVEHTLREDSTFQPERSDHITFLRAHIPSVWLTSDVHEQYRRPSDVVALVDIAGIVKVAELVGYAALDLGSKPTRPEYVKRGK
jgi:Zn-dependent M28 family amino/carboxypeptidase